VNGDPAIERAERLLQRTPPPDQVPPELHDVAREAVVGGPTPLAARKRGRAAWSVLGIAAALLAGFGAVALLTGGEGEAVEQRITLQGSAPSRDAWGRVEIEEADGPTRHFTVRVGKLPPAPGDGYYQVWFESQTGAVAGPAFDTGADGDAEVEGVAPANLRWKDCWIAHRRGRDDWVTVLQQSAGER
jgi:hypothetical protein